MTNAEYDVIIVGAGPAGSACSTLLARSGLRVLLLEKARFPRDKVCGECINPRAWKYVEALGVAEELRSADLHRITSFRVTNASGASVNGTIPFNHDEPFFSVSRAWFDSLLVENARNSGVSVMQETAVNGVWQSDFWTVLATRKGKPHLFRFTSDILIGADGRNSLVARTLSDLALNRLSGRSRLAAESSRIGVQWHTERQPRLGSAVELFLFRDGYGGAVNIDGTRANVALVVTSGLASLARQDFGRFIDATVLSNPRARAVLGNLTPVTNVLTSTPINPSIRYSLHPRAFLVGDAHRTVEPFTGEGIFFALQDAFAVAGHIVDSFNISRPFHTSQLPDRPFIANLFFSPLLRSPRVAGRLLAAGFLIPGLAPMIARSVFRSDPSSRKHGNDCP